MESVTIDDLNNKGDCAELFSLLCSDALNQPEEDVRNKLGIGLLPVDATSIARLVVHFGIPHSLTVTYSEPEKKLRHMPPAQVKRIEAKNESITSASITPGEDSPF